GRRRSAAAAPGCDARGELWLGAAGVHAAQRDRLRNRDGTGPPDDPGRAGAGRVRGLRPLGDPLVRVARRWLVAPTAGLSAPARKNLAGRRYISRPLASSEVEVPRNHERNEHQRTRSRRVPGLPPLAGSPSPGAAAT